MTTSQAPASVSPVSGLLKLALKRGIVALARLVWLLLVAVFAYVTYGRAIRESLEAADAPLDRKAKDVTRDVLESAKPDQRTAADIARELLQAVDEHPAAAQAEHVTDSRATRNEKPRAVQRELSEAERAENAAAEAISRRDEAGNSADEFLRQMREHTERRELALDRELARLQERERVEFKFFIILGSITVAFMALCALLFIAGVIAAAVPSAVATLFTGACTTIVKWLSKQTENRRAAVADVREDNIATLQAIQAVQLIRNPQQKDSEVAKLAAWLRDRAIKRGARIDADAA